MNRVSLFVRKITVPPVFATLLIVSVYIFYPNYFGSIQQLLLGIIFLTVLPILAYPLQKYIPHFKDKGRSGQRTLAMIFSFVGYLVGTITAFACSVPAELKIIYLEYLLCGVAILIFNKLLKQKVSGHACGIVGPVLLLMYFGLYIPAIIGSLFVVPVFISSIVTKRHTTRQLICGSIIPLSVQIALTAEEFIVGGIIPLVLFLTVCFIMKKEKRTDEHFV